MFAVVWEGGGRGDHLAGVPALGDITLPDGTMVATVIHDAKPIVPGDDHRFRYGDTVLVVTHIATEHEIHDAFQ
jgi:trk system potassium uptake protein TrkA